MNFVADESVDKQIVEKLREIGQVVDYIAELKPGITDKEVLGISNKKRAILLTSDKDFGELVVRMQYISSGVVLMRLVGLSNSRKAEIIASIISKHADKLPKTFTVITPSGIRIRRQLD